MATKKITYTGLLNEVYYKSKDIDSREVLQLLRQAKAIPGKLLPFKGVIHVIDYTQKKHVGISGPFKNIIGYEPGDFLNNGLDFVIDIFQKDDFKIYNETIFNEVIQYLRTTPHHEHSGYIFSFSYRMRRDDGRIINIYQQGSYITDPKTNLPLYGIGMATDITPLKKDSCMMFSIDRVYQDSNISGYKNIITQYYYPDPEESRLSRREREILGRLADGLSTKQIADKLFLSENTVSSHRKNMLKKTNSKNIAELIRYAISKGII